MFACEDCDQEMPTAETCLLPFVIMSGDRRIYRRVTAQPEPSGSRRCHDCGIGLAPGNVHHLGCDMEECPRCGSGRFIDCGCCDVGEEHTFVLALTMADAVQTSGEDTGHPAKWLLWDPVYVWRAARTIYVLGKCPECGNALTELNTWKRACTDPGCVFEFDLSTPPV